MSVDLVCCQQEQLHEHPKRPSSDKTQSTDAIDSARLQVNQAKIFNMRFTENT